MSPQHEPSFTRLRREGLAHAQEASGKIWTDFNLHDPGVTLLEQTCFALSELGHRSALPVRDLLTSADGSLDHAALGLAHARTALGMAPVTLRDIETRLSDVPGVARVAATLSDGRLELLVVPAAGSDRLEISARVGRIFHDERPLGIALGRMRLAEARPCRLSGEVEIAAGASAEDVAARIYHLCDRLVRDPAAGLLDLHTGGKGEGSQPITRETVFEMPELLYGAQHRHSGRVFADRALLLAIGQVDGVDDVRSFALRLLAPDAPSEPPNRDRPEGPRTDVFKKIVMPTPTTPAELRIVRDGQRVPCDPIALSAALDRLDAKEIAGRRNPHAGDQWELPDPGQVRPLAHTHVDADLPRAYAGAGGALWSGSAAEARRALAPLRRYRSIINRMIAGLTSDLASLPGLLAADARGDAARGHRETGWSYAASSAAVPSKRGAPAAISGPTEDPSPGHAATLDTYLSPFFALPEADMALSMLSGLPPGLDADEAAFAAFDPWPDRRQRALDYLIGLHGEEWPDGLVAGRDAYLDPGLTPQAEISRRARFLAELPVLNRKRGCGPNLTRMAAGSGYLRKLSLMLDLPDLPAADEPTTGLLASVGISLSADAPNPDGPPHADLVTPYDPLDMLVPIKDPGVMQDPTTVLADVGFLSSGTVSPRVFQAAARLESYILAPARAGRWRVLLDHGGRRLADGGSAEDRAGAIRLANRIRFACAALMSGSEGVHLIEHALLPADDLLRAPGRITLVFPDWTLRFHEDGFRHHVREIVARLTPAHLQADCIFLPWDTLKGLEDGILDWRRLLAEDAVATFSVSDGIERDQALDEAGTRVSATLVACGVAP